MSETTGMGRYAYKYDDAEPLEPIDESTIEHSIGEVIIWFEALDDAVSAAISGILNRGDTIGRVVATPLSFRLKVDMFSNLFKADRPESSIAGIIDDFCAACLQIEEERNKIVHSKWTRTLDGNAMDRSKFSAKMKHGLKETKETWAPGKFSSVWVHCGYLAHEIDEWMWAEYGRQYAPDALEDDPPRREPYERAVSGSEQETVKAYPFIGFGLERFYPAGLGCQRWSPGPQCFRAEGPCLRAAFQILQTTGN